MNDMKIQRIKRNGVSFQSEGTTAPQPKGYAKEYVNQMYKQPVKSQSNFTSKHPLQLPIMDKEPNVNIYDQFFKDIPSDFSDVPGYNDLKSEFKKQQDKIQKLEEEYENRAITEHFNATQFIKAEKNKLFSQEVQQQLDAMENKLNTLNISDSMKEEIRKRKAVELYNQDFVNDKTVYRDMKGEPLPDVTQAFLQLLKQSQETAEEEIEEQAGFGGGAAAGPEGQTDAFSVETPEFQALKQQLIQAGQDEMQRVIDDLEKVVESGTKSSMSGLGRGAFGDSFQSARTEAIKELNRTRASQLIQALQK